MLDETHEGEPDAATRYRVAAASRWAHTVTLVILTAMMAGMISIYRFSGVVVFFVVLVAAQIVNTVHLWRWEVTLHDDGVSLRQGLRKPTRHLAWDDIDGVLGGLPPTVETTDGDDVRLSAGIPRRLLDRVAGHIAREVARRH